MRNADRFPVEKMCKALKVSKSGYYAWRRRPDSARSLENKAIGIQVRQTGTQFRSHDFSRHDQAVCRELFRRQSLVPQTQSVKSPSNQDSK